MKCKFRNFETIKNYIKEIKRNKKKQEKQDLLTRQKSGEGEISSRQNIFVLEIR